MTQRHAEGWALKLNGHAADLAAWRRSLENSFDPRIELVERPGSDAEHVLRALAFDGLQSAAEVRNVGRRLIERLNGALRLAQAEEPVQAGEVLKFRSDGLIDRTILAEAGSIRLRGVMLHATAVTLGSDGKPLAPPPPQPSGVQRWATAAEQDDDIADLLMHFGRADGDWYEIYKTLEVAKRVGNRHGGYKALLGAEAKNVETMRQTANVFRHARGGTSGSPPPKPTTFTDAGPLLAWVVRVVLNAVTPP